MPSHRLLAYLRTPRGTSQKESQAKLFATAQYSEDVEDYFELRDRAVVDYLDSIGNAPIFGFTSYNDAKGKELN